MSFFFGFCVEIELLKERMAKLLLGEDMSGSGEGVCPALAISNAITNLYGSFFEKFHTLVCDALCGIYLICEF